METIEELHNKWCDNCEEWKPKTRKQKTWVIPGIIEGIEEIWEQWMTDLLTTCNNNVDATPCMEHHNKNNEQEVDIEERNKISCMIEATGTLRGFLESTLEKTGKEIEIELEGMQETLRTTWYRTFKRYEEGLDDEKKKQKEAMPRIRGGGDRKNDNDMEGIKVGDDDDRKNSDSSLSNPSFHAPQSRPNLKSEIGGAKLSWPSNQLHIPGSSDNIPEPGELGNAKRKSESSVPILAETLELNIIETTKRFHNDLYIIHHLVRLYAEYLGRSRGESFILRFVAST